MYIDIYTKKIIYSYWFLGVLTWCIIYISGFETALSMWAGLILYSVILFLIYALWKFLYGRQQVHYFLFFISFLYRVAWSFAIIILLLWTFLIYHNELRPATFPLYTVSNGEKTLKFQTMSHIGSDNFYKNIQENIKYQLGKWYVLFFEGVRPGTDENMKAFNEALGIDFSPTLYDNFSKFYGLRAQENDMFLWLGPKKDYNIDLDIDEIMKLYRKSTFLQTQENKKEESKSMLIDWKNIEEEFIALLSKLRPRELLILQYFNTWVLNFFMKQDTLQAFILDKAGSDIFSVILWDRNRFIVKNIIEHPEKNIFALYGKLHFEGVLEELQKEDPRWQIVWVEYLQVTD